METTVRRILDTVVSFNDAAWAWWSDVAAQGPWPPALGPWLLALVVLLLLAAFRRRRPPPLEVRPPQLLITQGEVVPEAAPQAPSRRRRRAGDPGGALAGRLTMTVSNLSRYPVQVLEVALRQESRGAPRVAELEAVVPALGAIEVEVRVPLGLAGDGWLDVYVYAAAPRHKLHRHRAELVWEPWVSRFKVAPMEQATTQAKRMASDEGRALFDLPEPPRVDLVEAPEPAPTTGAARRDGTARSERPVAATPFTTAVPAGADARAATQPDAPPSAPAAAAGPPAAPGPVVTAVPAADARPVSDPDVVAAPTPEAAATPRTVVEQLEPAASSSAATAVATPDVAEGPKSDATKLGALWARLPKREGARDVVPAAESAGSVPAAPAGRPARAGLGAADPAREEADVTPPVTEKPRRPRLEFPDDF